MTRLMTRIKRLSVLVRQAKDRRTNRTKRNENACCFELCDVNMCVCVFCYLPGDPALNELGSFWCV